jgi:TPR repeat protein
VLLSFSITLVIVAIKYIFPGSTARQIASSTHAAKKVTGRPHRSDKMQVLAPERKLDDGILPTAGGTQAPAQSISPTTEVNQAPQPQSAAPATAAGQSPACAAVQTADDKQASENISAYATTVKQAAERGNVAAQGCLGYLYATGSGVSQSYDDAAIWYRKAAEKGDAEAQKNLALLLTQGKGVPKNLKEALRWLRKAANQGNEEAQNALEIWNAQ